MRPMQCSDTDIRQASEIVMRVVLHTTAHVRHVDRSASTRGGRLEVEIHSDQERIEFERRVKAIHSRAAEVVQLCERVAA